jgi:hypothetical protein
MSNLAPVCLFTYARLDETQKTVRALQANFLAESSDLFIFSDGPANESTKAKVAAVRNYLRKIDGFKSITIIESPTNMGLANSIISGVSRIIEINGKVIVLEDDLVTSANFLNFMNTALNFYEIQSKIFSVSGFSFNLPSLKNHPKDFYLGYRASSWGWGTWANRWQQVDWEVKSYPSFKWNLLQHIKFMRGGSDMPRLLKAQLKGRIDSWAIRWCFHQFQNDTLTIFPSKSKLISIGFGQEATHTKRAKRFTTILDQGTQTTFTFDNDLKIEQKLAKEFRDRFSVINRLKDKLII